MNFESSETTLKHSNEYIPKRYHEDVSWIDDDNSLSSKRQGLCSHSKSSRFKETKDCTPISSCHESSSRGHSVTRQKKHSLKDGNPSQRSRSLSRHNVSDKRGRSTSAHMRGHSVSSKRDSRIEGKGHQDHDFHNIVGPSQRFKNPSRHELKDERGFSTSTMSGFQANGKVHQECDFHNNGSKSQRFENPSRHELKGKRGRSTSARMSAIREFQGDGKVHQECDFRNNGNPSQRCKSLSRHEVKDERGCSTSTQRRGRSVSTRKGACSPDDELKFANKSILKKSQKYVKKSTASQQLHLVVPLEHYTAKHHPGHFYPSMQGSIQSLNTEKTVLSEGEEQEADDEGIIKTAEQSLVQVQKVVSSEGVTQKTKNPFRRIWGRGLCRKAKSNKVEV